MPRVFDHSDMNPVQRNLCTSSKVLKLEKLAKFNAFLKIF
jgi:hypothetical protein